jgi:L-threonylcarbamoyladenylate synthase
MQSFHTQTGVNIQLAGSLLQEGEVVAIPTETVYGLAANALNEEAVLKIFEVKERPHFDPLIVHTHSVHEIEKYVTHIPAKAKLLIQKFSPGPITFLLQKKLIIPDLVTSGLDTVAVRIPDHPLALRLLRQLEFPLAAPSANPFGYISPTTASHVFDQLEGKIPYIIDGGSTSIGVESTIVGFAKKDESEEDEEVIIYRLGGLSVEEIEKAVGSVTLNVNESSNPLSPGMLKSHYAPRKKLLFNPGVKAEASGIGVIAFNKELTEYSKEHQILLSPAGDLHEAAKNLFAAMRTLDNSDVELIVAVQFPDEGLGKAINDRLKRAAAE